MLAGASGGAACSGGRLGLVILGDREDGRTRAGASSGRPKVWQAAAEVSCTTHLTRGRPTGSIRTGFALESSSMLCGTRYERI